MPLTRLTPPTPLTPLLPPWFHHPTNFILESKIHESPHCIIFCIILYFPLFFVARSSQWPRPPHCWRFGITLRYTTVGRTPLDEWSACRRVFYLTAHNTHNTQTPIPPAGFESPIPANERLQPHVLDGPATGIGTYPLLGPNTPQDTILENVLLIL